MFVLIIKKGKLIDIDELKYLEEESDSDSENDESDAPEANKIENKANNLNIK